MKRYLFLLFVFLFCSPHLQASSVTEEISSGENFRLPENPQALIDRVRKNQIKDYNIHKIEDLLKGGVDINAQDIYGFTALHWAAQTQNIFVTEKLIQLGANLDVLDEYGRKPLDLCLGNEQIQDLLSRNKETCMTGVDRTGAESNLSAEELELANKRIQDGSKAAEAIEKKIEEERKRLEGIKRNKKIRIAFAKKFKRHNENPGSSFGGRVVDAYNSVSKSVLVGATCAAACFAAKEGMNFCVDRSNNGTLPLPLQVTWSLAELSYILCIKFPLQVAKYYALIALPVITVGGFSQMYRNGLR